MGPLHKLVAIVPGPHGAVIVLAFRHRPTVLIVVNMQVVTAVT